jgi:hypothetical protein
MGATGTGAQAGASGGAVPRHRVHVIGWLRRPGAALLLPNWLAITIGRDIFTWRPLTRAELAHELAHVRQWQRHGAGFAVRYLWASWRSWRAGTGWYAGNRYERDARAAADRVREAAGDATAAAPPQAER